MSTRSTLAAALAATTAVATMAVTTAPAAPAAPARTATTSTAASATGGAGWLEPSYVAADLTGDGQVTTADLDALAARPGTTAADLAELAQEVLYDDGPFELVEASAIDMQKAMNAGVVTSVQLTQAYLDRIEAYDGLKDDTHSRPLNAIITTGGEEALAAAAASDAWRAEHGGPRSMLDGIPIALKDNYDTEDLPTSAGHGSWETNQTATDAFMVAGLREAGAVVLAKATLDEWAFGFVSEYTTGQPAGTSKLVASPYNLDRTAGGSSGGTGASVSANLAAIGFGTDTGGSIRVPSSYNQLVGVRPTVGLASRDGIVPLALSQDTGGPMARSVTDAAIALDAVVGVDPADPVTSEQVDEVPESYTRFLDPEALRGKRFAYLTSMVPTNNAATQRLFAQAVSELQAQGAVVEPVTTTALNATLAEPSGSTNEFKHDLDGYIAAHLDPDVATRSLADIIASGRLVPSRTSTYVGRNNVTPAQYEQWMTSHTAAIRTGEQALTSLLDGGDYDALVYPSTNGYGTIGTNMRLSPNTGMPAVTVPMGQATTGEAIPGAGVNLELVGRNYAEGDLLGYAYDYEQATKHRTTPALYPALTPPAPGTSPGTAPRGTVANRAEGYSVTVSDPEVEIGDEVTVTVAAGAAEDLYAYGLDLGFDPTLLRYDGAEATDAMPWSAVTTSGAGEGSVAVVASELGTSPATSGPVTLATLRFTAVGQGAAQVTAGPLESVASDLTVATTDEAGSGTVAVGLKTAPVATTAPTVVGTPRVGQVVRATGGAWDLDGVRLGYQWLVGGSPVPGATAPSYRLRVADVGRSLAVAVVATVPDHAPGVASSAARTVLRALTTTRASVRPARPRAAKRSTVVVTVAAAGVVPTGTVVVTWAQRRVGRPVVLTGGRARISLPPRARGTRWLRVVYRPTAAFGGSGTVRAVRVRR
ncbi:amidase family protein [Nocardioides litoris]|uniref:amidase family protein n=1 Tax=Nocardioides litoris TaxID=1926648 RepID=UPI0014777C03|nr:amidase family protein [Nocardioides litoris]